MGGEGHMLDMIRRLKDGKEASRLRRERRNDKLGRLEETTTLIFCRIRLRKRWNASSRIRKRKKKKITAISYGERSSLWAY